MSLWLALVAAVLSISLSDGRLAVAAIGRAVPVVLTDVAPPPSDSSTSASVTRPDFRASVIGVADGQTGRPFSYTVQVRNDGGAAGGVRVSTTLPPEFSNVRVNAPGFACTRQFTPSGAQAGTVVTCSRNSLDGGASADVTVEANAPAVPGEYRLLATADPRDDVTEADESNNQIVVTVRVAV